MEEPSWEFLEDFKKSYPKFELEDKLFIQEGSNDMQNAFVGKKYTKRSVRN